MMIMDGWVDYLHLDFLGEHVLFHSLRLYTLSSFVLSAVVISFICFLERFLTALSNKNVLPISVRRSRVATAAWKALLYGFLTFLRLLYMLVAMSNNLGAIAVVVMALSIGQFFIEYIGYREPKLGGSYAYEDHVISGKADRQAHDSAEEPLLRRPSRQLARPKPDDIFIHPSESNLSRADAVAFELGIAGDTDLVKGNKADGRAWDLGKGRDAAREAFSSSHRWPDTYGVDDDAS